MPPTPTTMAELPLPIPSSASGRSSSEAIPSPLHRAPRARIQRPTGWAALERGAEGKAVSSEEKTRWSPFANSAPPRPVPVSLKPQLEAGRILGVSDEEVGTREGGRV